MQLWNVDNMKLDMLQWIANATEAQAVFTSDMTITSHIRALTSRSITLHPHYEHASARKHFQVAYSFLGCASSTHVWQRLRELRTDFLILGRAFVLDFA